MNEAPNKPTAHAFLSPEEEREADARRGRARARHLEVGRRGERLARRYFFARNYRILATNFRVRGGEIDLIAEKRRRIHFIEVKTRSSDSLGAPEERVDREKRRRIRYAAQAYLEKFATPPRGGTQFDVLALVLDEAGRAVERNHLEDAF